ncbi:uncharacterized protein LOC108625144 [Ceratina calcarata]|uniref:Uncharacterized protein LOC108625144 n=1 Tax=Ceratina calcarata TaxID=156304 RepID=A0AAJ7IZE8_9HYME|nr:uncharacterized protein LOC108625144 [Ceratina calcarata]
MDRNERKLLMRQKIYEKIRLQMAKTIVRNGNGQRFQVALVHEDYPDVRWNPEQASNFARFIMNWIKWEYCDEWSERPIFERMSLRRGGFIFRCADRRSYNIMLSKLVNFATKDGKRLWLYDPVVLEAKMWPWIRDFRWLKEQYGNSLAIRRSAYMNAKNSKKR